ncbi:galactose mutarotase isoform X2 [Folsomia candida]|uniref:galactose mutarotase isoform X2 n=1 Tax=Folsomia candida TaxID=158441 RepID=UPI0016050A75|nr:galactose mutarotase isoform X2 [Folsomia candida]
MEIEITEDTFGTHPGGPDQEPRVVQRYTMTNPANGFSAQKMWEPSISGGRVVFSYHSTDGAEGYPGDLFTQVTFQLTTFNQLIIEYQAIVSKPCPVGYTNHTYFNLAGHQNGDKKLAGHFITINADDITPVNPVDLIITGEIAPVEGTRFDLRGNPDLHALLQQYPEGYDINYCLNMGDQQVYNARMEDSESGRVMLLTTDQPGMQLFTANGFPEEGAPPIVGKDGANYFKHGAFCFEAQNYPDAVNHAHFPTAILRPGNIHQHRTIYAFATMQK